MRNIFLISKLKYNDLTRRALSQDRVKAQFRIHKATTIQTLRTNNSLDDTKLQKSHFVTILQLYHCTVKGHWSIQCAKHDFNQD
jgi:hypothetical protein